MSSFDYSFDSDVEHDGMNIIDRTIDATSTACLDIVDLMTKGLNHRTRHSKLIASWMTSFDAFIDDLYTSSTSSKDCFPAVRQTARNTNRKVSRFEDNDVSASVIDDQLANQSLELDYSTFSSFVDASYVDQSGEFDYSIYNSDDCSSESDCSSDQSYDSEDSYNVSQSIEDMYSAPNSSKTRPKTMISITYAGRCIDQIEMGPFDNLAGSAEGKKHEKTLHTESKCSPSRSIITSGSELFLPSHVDTTTTSSSERQSYWSYLDCTDENLDSVSKTLFDNKVNFCSSPNDSKRMAKHCLVIPEKTSPTIHLFIYIARKSVYCDLPVSLVSHRRNALSKYNPFSSIMMLLFTCVLKHVDVEDDDTNWLEENKDDIDEESSLVTIILSDDTPLELAVDGSHNGPDCLNTYKVYWDYFDVDLELSSDDASYDSDLTPKFRHPKRVIWSL